MTLGTSQVTNLFTGFLQILHGRPGTPFRRPLVILPVFSIQPSGFEFVSGPVKRHRLIPSVSSKISSLLPFLSSNQQVHGPIHRQVWIVLPRRPSIRQKPKHLWDSCADCVKPIGVWSYLLLTCVTKPGFARALWCPCLFHNNDMNVIADVFFEHNFMLWKGKKKRDDLNRCLAHFPQYIVRRMRIYIYI